MPVTHRFECRTGGHNKFWEITVIGNTFTVHFGKIGTAGLYQEKRFFASSVAKREADRLISSKIGKGYIEVSTLSTQPIEVSTQLQNIRHVGPILPRVDPDEVAKALGAEPAQKDPYEERLKLRGKMLELD